MGCVNRCSAFAKAEQQQYRNTAQYLNKKKDIKKPSGRSRDGSWFL
ncbi:hypothetical protein [Nonlabens sp.]|nr:hypothetical protein [Nonlabens sp.]